MAGCWQEKSRHVPVLREEESGRSRQRDDRIRTLDMAEWSKTPTLPHDSPRGDDEYPMLKQTSALGKHTL